MIAQRLIEDARAFGLSIEVDGADLIIEADRDPPDELITELRVHKAEVIAFLLPQPGIHQTAAVGAPVLLRDGRRLYRFRVAEESTRQSGDAADLVDDARYRGAVLVVDGHELIVVERWLSALPEETLRALKNNAGSVIAVLLKRTQMTVGA